MSAPLFERVAVVGLGLLGGSVALATRRRGVARTVVGCTRSAEAAARALRERAVDLVAEPAEAARGAELVVLATPVEAMEAVLRRLAPGLGAGAIVTDVGSVKACLEDTLPGLLPPGCIYVGSHPMAGGHDRGIDHAREDLLEGAVCVVVRSGHATAAERVGAFWRALGAQVLERTAEQHDAHVAWMSHLPHLLAFAFAGSLPGAPSGALDLAGPGFRDFTRIARSDAELWAGILRANRKALAAPLDAARAALGDLAQALEAGDAEGLERLLSAARAALAAAAAPPSGGAPETTSEPSVAPERDANPETGDLDHAYE